MKKGANFKGKGTLHLEKKAHFKELLALVSWQIGQLTRAKLACYLCCNFFLSNSIINSALHWFSPWGFFQCLVDKKSMSSNMWCACVLLSVLSGKDQEVYLLF
jgi:hypothetical protein